MKVTDYVVDFFEKQGVKDVFLFSGGGCQHLIDSFGRSSKMKYWCLHHEQALAMATEAYARRSGNLGVAVVTSGPGGTNTITGLLGAYQDSSPCIFLSGQVKRSNMVYNCGIEGLRQMGQQEANIVPIVSSITKYAAVVNDPMSIRYHLEKAVVMAKEGRPGPVWLDFPLDVQGSVIDENCLEGYVPEINQKTIQNDDLEYVVDCLKNCERPVIVAGQGVRISGGEDEFRCLVEKFRIPVVNSYLGTDTLEGTNPCSIGRIGFNGSRAGNFTVQNADFVLVIGSRLSVSSIGFQPEFFAREAKVVIVDIDEIEHKKQGVKYDKLIIADAKDFLSQLNQKLAVYDTHFEKWLEKANSWKQKFSIFLPEYEDDSDGINYYKVLELINQYMTSDMTVVSDAGSAFYVTTQAINLKPGQRYITSGALATMGFTLPATVGVSIATSRGKVIGVTGDGSFQQNIQELASVKGNGLPVKLVVVNNDGYLSIRRTQKKKFGDNFVAEGPKSGVTFPDFKKVAEAYGIAYYYISSISEAHKLLPEAFENDDAAVIEVKSKEFQDLVPFLSSTRLADGTIVSKPLEDMSPLLDRDTFHKEMIVKPLE